MTDTALTLDRLIDAPLAKVWEAWSNPDHLKEWWTPKPWTTEIISFDLSAGGNFYLSMNGPDGEKMEIPGIFLKVSPAEEVIFTSALAEGWQPVHNDMPITAIIRMEDEGGKTRYRVRVLHKDAEDRAKHEEMGFEGGWGTVITQLEAYAQAM